MFSLRSSGPSGNTLTDEAALAVCFICNEMVSRSCCQKVWACGPDVGTSCSVLDCIPCIQKYRTTGPDTVDTQTTSRESRQLDPSQRVLVPLVNPVHQALETSGTVGTTVAPPGGGGGGGGSGDGLSDEDESMSTSDDPELEHLELKEHIHSHTCSYSIQHRMGSRKVVKKTMKTDVRFFATPSTNLTPNARVCDKMTVNRANLNIKLSLNMF